MPGSKKTSTGQFGSPQPSGAQTSPPDQSQASQEVEEEAAMPSTSQWPSDQSSGHELPDEDRHSLEEMIVIRAEGKGRGGGIEMKNAEQEG